MAGHALQRVTFLECQWITKTDGHSNLTYSEFHHITSRGFFRKVAGVVDRTALEMRRTGNCTGGSNPSLSALVRKASMQDNLLRTDYLKLLLRSKKSCLKNDR